jgi:hypothetical protein
MAMHGDPNAKRGGVTAWAYCTVLDKDPPTVLVVDSIVMHNNACSYLAKYTKKWLKDNNIAVVE